MPRTTRASGQGQEGDFSNFRDGGKTGSSPASFIGLKGLKGTGIQLRCDIWPWVLMYKPRRGWASVSLLGGLQPAMNAWSGESRVQARGTVVLL